MLRGPMTLSATVAAIVDIPRYNIQTVDIYAGHHTGIVGMLGELCSYCRYYYMIYNIGCKYNIYAVDIFAWSLHCIVGMLGELERRENINIPLPIGSQREYY